MFVSQICSAEMLKSTSRSFRTFWKFVKNGDWSQFGQTALGQSWLQNELEHWEPSEKQRRFLCSSPDLSHHPALEEHLPRVRF